MAAKKLLALCLLVFTSMAYAVDVKTFIPTNAYKYRDALIKEINLYFPDIPTNAYIPALIEQESCAPLSEKNKRCFESTAELKTYREQGVGLGQITRAYKKDGSLRFDSLAGMRSKYTNELKEASWDTIHARPDLQIRMLVLMSRDNYRALRDIKDPIVRLQGTDSAYNSGLGSVYKRMRICGLTKNCSPQIWFGHLETICPMSTAVMEGYGKSPCQINNEHVNYVFNYRLNKYKAFMN